MSTGEEAQLRQSQSQSPDPSSHIFNVYDIAGSENGTDELDDDDMDFEPTTDEGENADFLDADGNDEEFHGTGLSYFQRIVKWLTLFVWAFRCRGWAQRC